MLIEIHAVQNHSPANLNRDDLGAPKTCYFGGVLRSRISSQCLKRSIRMSPQFARLLGGIRTRQLAVLIARECPDLKDAQKRAEKILGICGLEPKKGKKRDAEDAAESDKSKMLVYTTREAVREMAALLKTGITQSEDDLAKEFGKLIASRTCAPDMALSGRMLETGVLTDTTVEAALQVAHALSTHEARPEVDYYVAADDVPGEDAGAGYVDEAMFASACFYKYFSIHWEQLLANLRSNDALAAHTVGAFLRGAALTNPTGKQNSCAAHNLPEGVLVEIKSCPVSYANAFVRPVAAGDRDIIAESIAQLAAYVNDLDVGFGRPQRRFWFSPNLRHRLVVQQDKGEAPLADVNCRSLDELVSGVIGALGHDWEQVQKAIVNPEAAA